MKRKPKVVKSVTADLDVPRWARTHTFHQLQAHWYQRLREEGFVDIETGHDTNREKAYDPRTGERCSRLLHFPADEHGDVDIEAMMAVNAQVFGGHVGVSETPTALAWREISHAANDLPRGYPRRLFLIDLAQTGCIAHYLLARHKLTWGAGHAAFERFLEEVGLGGYRGILVRGPSLDRGSMLHDEQEIEAERSLSASARLLLQRGTISRSDFTRYTGRAA